MSLHSKILKLSALVVTALGITFAIAQANADEHGHDNKLSEASYKPVTSQFKVSTGDKIEVAELFWFGCGHCFALEPSLKTWKKTIPENAAFVKIPAIFSSRWEFHGRAFYTIQSLNVPEEAYDGFFHSIHIKRKQINNLSTLIAFLKVFDKTEEQVISAFNSFEVDSKVRAAKKISRESGATGVPAMVVDGKYMTNQSLGKGVKGMFATVDQLIEKAAAER